MQRYQIRMPNGWIVEDLIEEMSGKGWDAIKDNLDFSNSLAPLKDYRRFQNKLYKAMVPHVHALRLCGIDEICSDLIESAPLSSNPDKFEVSPWDSIYHLFIPVDLHDFVDVLAHQAMQGIETLIKPGKEDQVSQSLREEFKSILADYVYWNPVCGKARICIRALAIPLPFSENPLTAAAH